MNPALGYSFLIPLLLGLLLLYCFFILSAVSLQRARLSQLEEAGENASRRVRCARLSLERADYYILTARVGVWLSSALAGIALLFMARYWAVSNLPGQEWLSPFWLGCIWLLMLLLLGAFVFLVGGQISRALAHSHAERVLCLLSPVLFVCARLFWPFTALLVVLGRSITRSAGLEPLPVREQAVSVEELSELVDISSEAGEIEPEEKDMIQSMVTFSSTCVREVMTPRSDIVFVGSDATLEEVTALVASEGFSRILVTGEGLDDVKGVLHAKDMVRFAIQKGAEFNLLGMLRKPHFVSGSENIDDLLRDLRKKAVHMAVVIDEHGGVDGLVTIEDLIEEIVGEIFDEYDVPSEEITVLKMRSGDLLVDGSALIDDLNAMYKCHFPVGEYDTIAGFVMHHLGRIPEERESFEYAGLKIVIEALEQNRITLLRLERLGRKGASISTQ